MTEEVKKPFEILTAVHARNLLRLAEARLIKQQEAVNVTVAQIENYKQLAATLPEGAPASVKVAVPVRSVVEFAFGREDKRTTFTGTVVAIKFDEKGAPSQYKVQVGEGFDLDFKTVFPGSITKVVSQPGVDAPAEVAGTQSDGDDPLAG